MEYRLSLYVVDSFSSAGSVPDIGVMAKCPSHLAQNRVVALLPITIIAIMTRDRNRGAVAVMPMAAHLPSRTPKRGRNMLTMPTIVIVAVTGSLVISPFQSSICRVWRRFSITPAHMKSSPLLMLWNSSSMIAAE